MWQIGARGVDVVDVVINNAGIATGTHPVDPGTSCTKEDMMTVYETNVCGATHVSQAFLLLMNQSTVKKVVNISSGLGSINNAATKPNPGTLQLRNEAEGSIADNWWAQVGSQVIGAVRLL